VAFEPISFGNKGFRVIGLIIDSMFALDLLIQFRSTVIGESNVEITNGKEIACRYVKSWRFIIDIFSCIPYD